jgi:hypothetical protein
VARKGQNDFYFISLFVLKLLVSQGVISRNYNDSQYNSFNS